MDEVTVDRSRENFMNYAAAMLLVKTPNDEEWDDLKKTILGAHTHYVQKDIGKEQLGLQRILTENHQWIVPAIKEIQEEWVAAGHALPFDFLDPESGKVFQELGETIGKMEKESTHHGETMG